MFSNCSALQTVPLFDTSNVTSMSTTFANCRILPEIPLSNTVLVTLIQGVFSSCYGLQELPALNFNGVASAANASGAFSSTQRLSKSAVTVLRFSHNYTSCKLSKIRLEEIFTNLPVVTGQTITISGNYGAATCDRTIATAKGWAVVG